MNLRPLAAAALVAVLGLSAAGCDDDAAESPSARPAPQSDITPSTEVPTEPQRLPIGKGDFATTVGPYLSPEGFEPALRLQVPAGWTSTHRDTDGFDLGQPNLDSDAPLVAVAFLVPPEESAEAALAAVRQSADAAGSRVAELTDPVGPLGLTGLDATGGVGQLVSSRDGGIALDALAGGRVQVLAADVGGSPLLVVVYVPDSTLFDDASGSALRLTEGVTAA